MIGGDPSLGDLTDWPSWTKTFYNAPAVVSYKVRDITDMIWDPASASAIRRAIEDKAGGWPMDRQLHQRLRHHRQSREAAHERK